MGEQVTFHFAVEMRAIAKPRMTRADQWKQRPAVRKYHEFVDAIRAAVIDTKRTMGLPDDFKIATRVAIQILFLPDSTVVQVREVEGTPRGTRAGDIDNLCKSVLEGLQPQAGTLAPILIDDDSQVVELFAVIEEVERRMGDG